MLCNSKTGYPVFDSSESPFDEEHFVICGGGGAAKAGIPNKVQLCKLGDRENGIAGVSLVPVAHVETRTQIATTCCFLTATVIAFAIESEIILAEKKGESLVELQRETNKRKENIEVLRACKQLLLAGTPSGQVLLYEFADQRIKPYRTLQFHLKSIVDLCFDKTGNTLATVSQDETLRVWSLENLKAEHILPADSQAGLTYRKARFSSPFIDDDGHGIRLFTLQVPRNRKGASFVVVWERRGQKQVEWDIVNVRQIAPVLATAIAVSQDGRYVAVGTAEMSVQILDQQTLEPLRIMKKVHGLPVTGLFFRTNTRGASTYVVSSSADGTCAMIAIDDIGSVNLKRWIRKIVLVLTFLVSFFLLCVVAFVSRNVDGRSARKNFWQSLTRPADTDLGRLNTEHVTEFLSDFMAIRK